MQSKINDQANDKNEIEGARNTTEALVEPGIRFFNQNCALKVQSVSLDCVVLSEVLQSSNAESLSGTIVEFDDLENDRSITIEISNA